jgi:hypothetical protein
VNGKTLWAVTAKEDPANSIQVVGCDLELTVKLISGSSMPKKMA